MHRKAPQIASGARFFYARAVVAQRLQHAIDDPARVEARRLILLVRTVVILEQIGQAQGADFQPRVGQDLLGVAARGADKRFFLYLKSNDAHK